MSDQEILNIMECSDEFCNLSSDSNPGSNVSEDQDSLPSLVYPRKRSKPISDEENEDDDEDLFSWKRAKQSMHVAHDKCSNENSHGNKENQLLESAVKESEDFLESANSSPAIDPFNFSSDEDEEESKLEDDDEENDLEIGGKRREEKAQEEEEGLEEEDDYNPYVSENQSSEEEEKEEDDEEEDEDEDCLNILCVSKLFKKKIKKYGISQRMAAKHILKCSQSNLSDLFSKACNKSAKDLTHRGKHLYREMQKWLSSEEKQKETKKKCSQQRGKKLDLYQGL